MGQGWTWWLTSINLITQRWRLGGFHFEASPGKKVSKTPISTNKPFVVVHVYNPNYGGGVNRRVVVQVGLAGLV
jgi:hypothetical protein